MVMKIRGRCEKIWDIGGDGYGAYAEWEDYGREKMLILDMGRYIGRN